VSQAQAIEFIIRSFLDVVGRDDFGRVAEIRDHLTRLLKVLGHE